MLKSKTKSKTNNITKTITKSKTNNITKTKSKSSSKIKKIVINLLNSSHEEAKTILAKIINNKTLRLIYNSIDISNYPEYDVDYLLSIIQLINIRIIELTVLQQEKQKLKIYRENIKKLKSRYTLITHYKEEINKRFRIDTNTQPLLEQLQGKIRLVYWQFKKVNDTQNKATHELKQIEEGKHNEINISDKQRLIENIVKEVKKEIDLLELVIKIGEEIVYELEKIRINYKLNSASGLKLTKNKSQRNKQSIKLKTRT